MRYSHQATFLPVSSSQSINKFFMLLILEKTPVSIVSIKKAVQITMIYGL